MARGRMIDRRICLSNKFADLKSDKHRLLYLMIYPHLDVEGRFVSDLRDIKDECVRKLRFSLPTIANALIDLHLVGLLRLYEANNELFLEYCKFHEFQKIDKKREGKSKCPENNKSTATGLQQWCEVTAKEYKINLTKYKELNKSNKKEIDFSFEERKFLNIKIEDKAGWKDAYPAVDIDQELRIAREWLLANPSKRKSNYRQFLNNWFRREQDKGGRQQYQKTANGRPMTRKEEKEKKIDDWVKGKDEK